VFRIDIKMDVWKNSYVTSKYCMMGTYLRLENKISKYDITKQRIQTNENAAWKWKYNFQNVSLCLIFVPKFIHTWTL
jgi:hypothetical protein